MPKKFDFRPYKKGDETAIEDLFKNAFNQTMPPGFWHWRFGHNKLGMQMIELAWDSEILAGHYAASPINLQIDNTILPVSLSGTTMTHKDYRGQGLFGNLASRLYERITQAGVAAILGFPNNASHRGFIKNLAWHDIAEIPNFHLPLPETDQFPQVDSQIKQINHFDARFNALWESVRSRFHIIIKRDAQYLNWRFINNPAHTYTVFTAETDDRVVGYIVCKFYGDMLDIVDFLAIDDDVFTELVLAMIKLAYEKKLRGVNTWLNVHHSMHGNLEKFGFSNQAPVTYYGGRIFAVERINSLPFFDYRNWYITMADSDVY